MKVMMEQQISSTQVRDNRKHNNVQKKHDKKEIYKRVDGYTAACDKIKQQPEEVYRSLGAARGRRINSSKSAKLQGVKSANYIEIEN